MPQFIETNHGWINLDYVRRIKSRKVSGKHEGWTLFDAADHEMAEAIDFSPGSFPPVIPASSGAIAFVVTVFDDGTEPSATTVPIIGWIVGNGEPDAILIEIPAANEMAFIILPSGKLIRQYEREFTDRAECIAYAVEMLGKS
jgi:hypothetical protein